MMNTVPRNLRLATTTASIARPSWVGAIKDSIELRRPKRSQVGALGQRARPIDDTDGQLPNLASWAWTLSAGPFVQDDVELPIRQPLDLDDRVDAAGRKLVDRRLAVARSILKGGSTFGVDAGWRDIHDPVRGRDGPRRQLVVVGHDGDPVERPPVEGAASIGVMATPTASTSG